MYGEEDLNKRMDHSSLWIDIWRRMIRNNSEPHIETIQVKDVNFTQCCLFSVYLDAGYIASYHPQYIVFVIYSNPKHSCMGLVC